MEPANILVIEDDYIVARTIERSLRSDEFHVLIASRGEKGLYMARQNPPDLVILDIIMPGMDGYEVCRRIRQEESWQKLPVIMLTAMNGEEDRKRGKEAGADLFLPKPISPRELLSLVETAIR